MFKGLAYYLIFGKPLIMYAGILTLFSFLSTALIAFLNSKGIHGIPFKWHKRMAVVSITLAVIHGLLGILQYF